MNAEVSRDFQKFVKKTNKQSRTNRSSTEIFEMGTLLHSHRTFQNVQICSSSECPQSKKNKINHKSCKIDYSLKIPWNPMNLSSTKTGLEKYASQELHSFAFKDSQKSPKVYGNLGFPKSLPNQSSTSKTTAWKCEPFIDTVALSRETCRLEPGPALMASLCLLIQALIWQRSKVVNEELCR